MSDYSAAARWYQEADNSRWRVARVAFQVVGLRRRDETAKLAAAIRRRVDTVETLAAAYGLFMELCYQEWFSGGDSVSIRKLRREHPYTRWAVIYRQFRDHEFSIDEAREYLENFEGGNAALSAEIENRYGAPEWQRRAYSIYKDAFKLREDFTAPPELTEAALEFCSRYDKWVKAENE